MEILVWLAQFVVPLVGWWLFITQVQALFTNGRVEKWGVGFQNDFFRSLVFTFLHATPEFHLQRLENTELPSRIRLLWLGLRSFSFAFMFLFLFLALQFLPAAVFLLLSLVAFIASQWWKSLAKWPLLFVGLAVFVFGFEALLKASSAWTRLGESEAWIFYLSENYLKGALIGFALGGLLRLVTRLSGVAWWTSLNLLFAGVLSLGAAWGFILGDIFFGLLEDTGRFKAKDFRLRMGMGIGLSLGFLILSAPLQLISMAILHQEYSVQLRSLQLALMVGIFLFIESFVAMAFFHFYHLRQSRD